MLTSTLPTASTGSGVVGSVLTCYIYIVYTSYITAPRGTNIIIHPNNGFVNNYFYYFFLDNLLTRWYNRGIWVFYKQQIIKTKEN